MDYETESFILDLLSERKEEMATIMATHRIRSAAHTDRVYIIEDGRIQSHGSSEILSSLYLVTP